MFEKLKKKLMYGESKEYPLVHFHWHAQNLNEKKGDDFHHPSGHIFGHGRAWFNIDYGRSKKGKHGDILYPHSFQIHPEWSLLSKSCNVGVMLKECDDDITFYWAFPPVSIYLSFTGIPKWMRTQMWNRDTSIRIFDWTLWLNFWRCESEWTSKKPMRDWKGRWLGWEWRINFIDALLGRTEHSEEVLRTEPILVPMPERSYKGKCKTVRSSWKRKRFSFIPFPPFSRVMVRTKVDMDEGEQVPFPGKGENSWDCGEDALFGQSSPSKDAVEATASVVESVMRSRTRYGSGINWRPAPKKPKLVPPPDDGPKEARA